MYPSRSSTDCPTTKYSYGQHIDDVSMFGLSGSNISKHAFTDCDCKEDISGDIFYNGLGSGVDADLNADISTGVGADVGTGMGVVVGIGVVAGVGIGVCNDLSSGDAVDVGLGVNGAICVDMSDGGEVNENVAVGVGVDVGKLGGIHGVGGGVGTNGICNSHYTSDTGCVHGKNGDDGDITAVSSGGASGDDSACDCGYKGVATVTSSAIFEGTNFISENFNILEEQKGCMLKCSEFLTSKTKRSHFPYNEKGSEKKKPRSEHCRKTINNEEEFYVPAIKEKQNCSQLSMTVRNSTSTNTKMKIKQSHNIIRGKTSIFLHETTANIISFKKIDISSVRISTSGYTNVVAVETLQFQKTNNKLRGHSCMIYHENKWILFFVWNASKILEGTVVGYIYNGDNFSNSDILSLSLSMRDKQFCWVNLHEKSFPKGILPDLQYPVEVLNGYYFGNHTPSKINLPVPILGALNVIHKRTNLSTAEQCDKIIYIKNEKNTQSVGIDIGTPLVHKHRRGSGKKLCNVFKTKYTLGLDYITVFIPEGYNVPYQRFLQNSDFLIPVPYIHSEKCIYGHPFCTVDYALTSYININNLQDLEPKEYNKVLDEIMVTKFSLYKPTSQNPIRFCVVRDNEFCELAESLKLYSWEALQTKTSENKTNCCELKRVTEDDGQTKFLYGITNLPNVLLPGVCVSMWRQSSLILDTPLGFPDAVEKSFGRGFGDRSCAPCIGVNAYFGHHYSKRVIDRPETKPGTRIFDHYARQTDKYHESIPICQKFVYDQACRVRDVTRTMNNNYMEFIGYSTCDRIIWTQGKNQKITKQSTPGHQHQRSISFANKLHIDKCDIVKSETAETWFDWLEKLKENKCNTSNKKEAANYVITKFRETQSMFGIGLPTTCGYAHVVEEKNDFVEIKSSFIQMNFAMPLTNKVIHHMYAWAFPHATALSIALTSDSRILVQNGITPERTINIVAWGNSGGSKHAERRNINH